MNNSFLDSLKRNQNFTETENGATAHITTFNAVYDMFALGGSYRVRSEEDVILLFKQALEQNEELAMKCLFYLRDIRGGQGERRFFRVCMRWLAKNHTEIASRNIQYMADYGRWDDLFCFIGTPLEKEMFSLIEAQLKLDLESLQSGDSAGVSLLAKWLKSNNTSNAEARKIAHKTRVALHLSRKQYRKILSALRTRINIVEKLMSENRWNEIEFDKIPSKAGLIYRNAYAHKDIIADKYAAFMANKNTKVNTSALYPYEIVHKALSKISWNGSVNMTETERETLNKYWDNQIDYLNGKKSKTICVIDTSGSMTSGYGTSVNPIDVAISLGLYTAERIGEPFKNHFISFSSRPQLVETIGVDFVDKVRRIYNNSIVEDTNLEAVFNLLLKTIKNNGVNENDIPENIVVISDMEINRGSYWDKSEVKTEMEAIREEWTKEGFKLPKLVYWNVCARQNLILDDGEDVSYVSGYSPVIFKSILTGKTGYDLCLETITSERYSVIK